MLGSIQLISYVLQEMVVEILNGHKIRKQMVIHNISPLGQSIIAIIWCVPLAVKSHKLFSTFFSNFPQTQLRVAQLCTQICNWSKHFDPQTGKFDFFLFVQNCFSILFSSFAWLYLSMQPLCTGYQHLIVSFWGVPNANLSCFAYIFKNSPASFISNFA